MTITLKKSPTRVTVKDASQGVVEAVFCTFDVIDHDGDVPRKAAFTDGAPVIISSYGHRSWNGDLPVGKGRLRLTDTEAIVDAKFFLTTDPGRNTFHTVKEMSEGDDNLQEWSFSLENVKSKTIEIDGRQANEILHVDVSEVSPVLKGAGINTRTLAVKGAKQTRSSLDSTLRTAGRERWGDDDTYVWVADWDADDLWAVFEISDPEIERLVRVEFTRDGDSVELADDESEVQRTISYAPKSGARFLEQAATVLADVDQLIARATEVVALRAAKGKTIADDSAEVLTRLDGSLDLLKQLLAAPAPETADDALQHEWLRSVRILQGVTT